MDEKECVGRNAGAGVRVKREGVGVPDRDGVRDRAGVACPLRLDDMTRQLRYYQASPSRRSYTQFPKGIDPGYCTIRRYVVRSGWTEITRSFEMVATRAYAMLIRATT